MTKRAPANPIVVGKPGYDGVTLRDEFAKAALPVMIHFVNGSAGGMEFLGPAAASAAYAYADAMLAERERDK